MFSPYYEMFDMDYCFVLFLIMRPHQLQLYQKEITFIVVYKKHASGIIFLILYFIKFFPTI